MKIGFLIKDDTQHENLIESLKSRGCDTISYITRDHLEPIDIMELSRFIYETDCDIIHNESGTIPLVFNPWIKIPLLTVLSTSLSDDDLQIIKTSCRKCYFASADMSIVPNEILDRTFPVSSPDITESYYGIYENIKKETATIDRRPWGFYEIISEKDDHKVKRITVNPGKRLSLQSHKRRSEHWIIVSGRGVVTLNNNNYDLGEGESIDIMKGAAHRIANPGDSPLIFIEIQMGDYFGEDDIVRLEDDFGRA
jgi:mannose-6-phosphate isomerase-like protein (cupin superfamily)